MYNCCFPLRLVYFVWIFGKGDVDIHLFFSMPPPPHSVRVTTPPFSLSSSNVRTAAVPYRSTSCYTTFTFYFVQQLNDCFLPSFLSVCLFFPFTSTSLYFTATAAPGVSLFFVGSCKYCCLIRCKKGIGVGAKE
ncbi:hypothetical protein, unlikely [Trypanosoma brucei brucei TREU927]|uniref:Uncharacterized protein n=1 Tax=Trypanosoma brucei brucei (strain 927/4 GUTat10.1) TaxID=185431 RepID=Q38FP8_TRYB2|nr:hypothetical protein, unlikely [Trypanosoma brucei brucei TREU927]EAN76372.1 hypothetical protein, unlikely [Trypanosoma brucei brucei TREU927]